GYTAPATELQRRVAAVWADVLGVDRVGVHDGFFDLGGHSIRALVLAAALREDGLDVSVRDLLELRTVAELCAVLAGRGAAAPAAPAVAPVALVPPADRALLPSGLDDAYPLTQVQLGMLVETLSGAGPDGRRPYHHVVSFTVHDERPFDEAALRAAVAAVAARHDVLRTSVDPTGCSVPMQLVHSAAGVPLRVVDLRGTADAEERVRRFVAEETDAPFDPTVAPLLRLAVLRETDAAWRLAVTFSHVVVEGWSLHALFTELVDTYRAVLAGLPAEGPGGSPPPVRFADVVAGELAALDSAADRAHWTGLVGRYARFTLPAAWGDPAAPARWFTTRVRFDDLLDRLREHASAARVSLKSVLHAAHLAVLGRLTTEERFHSGLVGHIRPDVAGAERVFGMSLNTLPFPHDRSARTWRELVTAVHATEIAQWPHRRFPAPAVPRGGAARLTEVFFSYLDFDDVVDDRVDLGSGVGGGTTGFPLGVTAVPGELELTADARAVTPAAARLLAGLYREALAALAADLDG
ncbi:MAG TPA: condensation domain-containing protein, partial [Pseudonocardiaceae bacterium]